MHSCDNDFYKSTKIFLYYVDDCFYKKKGLFMQSKQNNRKTT